MNNLQELSAVMIGTEVTITGGMTMAEDGMATMIGSVETGTGIMAGASIRPISNLVSLA